MTQTFPATLTDGQSALRHPVTVELGAIGLKIIPRGTSETSPRDWDYTSLQRVVGPVSEQECRIFSTAEPNARLVVMNGAQFVQAIENSAPQIRNQKRQRVADFRKFFIWSGGGIAASLALYFGLEAASPYLGNLISVEWEQQFGDSALVEMLADQPVCEYPKGLKALEKMQETLVKASGTDRKITVRVMNDPMVNAFALPGGHILVFKGLIKKAETPEEVAGVIAHEIGHVHHRHVMSRLVEMMMMDFVGTLLTGGSMDSTQLIALMAYSRDKEREADRFAVATLKQANIPRSGVADFFDRLQKEEAKDESWLSFFAFSLLSSHPHSKERAEMMRKNDSPGEKFYTDQDWKDLRTVCKSSRTMPKSQIKPQEPPKAD